MSLRVVGAGLGRTGTLSLKLALERLLEGRCYHMMETFGRPQDVGVWQHAANGDFPDWGEFLADYRAVVDWPASAFWPELAEAFPDALILLSTRPAEAWYKSAHDTIFAGFRDGSIDSAPAMAPWLAMVTDLFNTRFTMDMEDRDACMAAFDAHNAHVRATAPRERLLEWQPGDGWEPICGALDLPVPDEPFPHRNTTAEFNSRRAAAT